MFNPPNDLIGSFNVDCSFGLVEHFADTVDAIKACSKFAKPDGLIVTLISNMTAINGFFYKQFNRKVFETHLPLTLNDLIKAHTDAGLKLLRKSHILGSTGILDVNRI